MLTQADLDAATKRGEVVTQKQLTKAKKVAELSKLLAVLPLGALAKVCNASVAELAGMDADGLARHFVTRGRRSMWSVGQARDCRNTWARFMVFLDQRGIVHDGMVLVCAGAARSATPLKSCPRRGATHKAKRSISSEESSLALVVVSFTARATALSLIHI